MPRPSIQFDALGTHWWIEILDNPIDDAIEALIRARVLQFQDDYSRFLSASYVGRLNHDKQLFAPPAELVDMLLFARDMHTATNGIFNISVGATLTDLGYGQGQQGTRLRAVFWDSVQITADLIKIPADTEIDLGGLGKGWLIDTVGQLLQLHGHDHYVINGGGDILVSSPVPVELALEHPTDATKQIGTTRITRGALAVSSTKKRVWKKADAVHHHIIDPRIDSSSDSNIAATYIRASSARIADVMATVLLIAPDQNDVLVAAYGLQTILVSETQLVKS
jgi:FAD:protein FMN transferase